MRETELISHASHPAKNWTPTKSSRPSVQAAWAKSVMMDATYVLEGRPDQALTDYQKLEPQGPMAKMLEAEALAGQGRRDEALSLMRPFEEHSEDGAFSMAGFAQTYALLGDAPNTVKWLEKSADQREYTALDIAAPSTRGCATVPDSRR